MGNIPSLRDRLLAEILQLPAEEKLDLVEAIWASLAAGAYNPAPSEETKAELDRRVADFEENPGDEYSWEEVRERLLRDR
jgi:putative addiction module component (TIGR02574 family)